jgi:ribosomal protein S6E (S10)
MPTLDPNISYELKETYTTETDENRIVVVLKQTISQEIDGSFVNTAYEFAKLDIGYGSSNVATANVELLLYEAVPQYFTE